MGGPEYDLSEQDQISCNDDMSGCQGGSMESLKFWYNKGPMKENCTGYGDYITSYPPESDVLCTNLNSCERLSYTVTDYYTVDTSDVNEIKASLYQDGPAYFTFKAPSSFFVFWKDASSGDVYNPRC